MSRDLQALKEITEKQLLNLNRPAVSQPGRLEHNGATCFPVKLQKNSCVIRRKSDPQIPNSGAAPWRGL